MEQDTLANIIALIGLVLSTYILGKKHVNKSRNQRNKFRTNASNNKELSNIKRIKKELFSAFIKIEKKIIPITSSSLIRNKYLTYKDSNAEK